MPSARDIAFIGCRLIPRWLLRCLSQSVLPVGTGLIFATLCGRPALADMGPIVVVPLAGFGLLHILLGAATVWPKSMTGHRLVAIGIYMIAVVGAWAINLFLPVDSLGDFWVVLALPLATSIGLVLYFSLHRKRRCRAMQRVDLEDA